MAKISGFSSDSFEESENELDANDSVYEPPTDGGLQEESLDSSIDGCTDSDDDNQFVKKRNGRFRTNANKSNNGKKNGTDVNRNARYRNEKNNKNSSRKSSSIDENDDNDSISNNKQKNNKRGNTNNKKNNQNNTKKKNGKNNENINIQNANGDYNNGNFNSDSENDSNAESRKLCKDNNDKSKKREKKSNKKENSNESSINGKNDTDMTGSTKPEKKGRRGNGKGKKKEESEWYDEPSRMHMPLVNEDGSLYRNIANFGLSKGQVAAKKQTTTQGEYAGLAIRALTNVKYLFHTQAMDEACTMVKKGDDLQKVSHHLQHNDPSTVLALIGKWYRDIAKTGIPEGPYAESLKRDEQRLYDSCGHYGLKNESKKKKNNENENDNDNDNDGDVVLPPHAFPVHNGTFKHTWNGIYSSECSICRMIYRRFDILNFKFMLESVPNWMPKEWIGKIYNNSHEFHKDIDSLPGRETKPPVMYAAIYNMSVVNDNINSGEWLTKIEMKRFLFARNLLDKVYSTVIVKYDKSIALKINVNIYKGFGNGKLDIDDKKMEQKQNSNDNNNEIDIETDNDDNSEIDDKDLSKSNSNSKSDGKSKKQGKEKSKNDNSNSDENGGEEEQDIVLESKNKRKVKPKAQSKSKNKRKGKEKNDDDSECDDSANIEKDENGHVMPNEKDIRYRVLMGLTRTFGDTYPIVIGLQGFPKRRGWGYDQDIETSVDINNNDKSKEKHNEKDKDKSNEKDKENGNENENENSNENEENIQENEDNDEDEDEEDIMPRGSPGHYASQLQKCIRRGSQCQLSLLEAIDGILRAKTQFIANLQFAACSGVRQLCWRLFITALEDVHPYCAHKTNDRIYWPMNVLMGLALAAQADPSFSLPKDARIIAKQTALCIQASMKTFDWREYKERSFSKNSLLNLELNYFDDSINNDIVSKNCSLDRDLMRCMINVMPCMPGDLQLLLIVLKYCKWGKIVSDMKNEKPKKSLTNKSKKSNKNGRGNRGRKKRNRMDSSEDEFDSEEEEEENDSSDNDDIEIGNKKKKNENIEYFYQLPCVNSINQIDIEQLKWKPPKLNEDSAHNRFDKTAENEDDCGSSFLKAINTKQQIHGMSNMNNNNENENSNENNNNNNNNNSNDNDISVGTGNMKRKGNSCSVGENEMPRLVSPTTSTSMCNTTNNSPNHNDNNNNKPIVLTFTKQDLEARQAAIDMHCYRHIILFVQASLGFPPCSGESTINIACKIWEWQSSFNIRENTMKYRLPRPMIKHNMQKSKSTSNDNSNDNDNSSGNLEVKLYQEGEKAMEEFGMKMKKKYKYFDIGDSRAYHLLHTIINVQKTMLNERDPNFDTPDFDTLPPIIPLYRDGNAVKFAPNEPMSAVYRAAFISILGKKYHLKRINNANPALTITVAGTKNEPCMVQRGKGIISVKQEDDVNPYKYLEGKERLKGEKRFIDTLCGQFCANNKRRRKVKPQKTINENDNCNENENENDDNANYISYHLPPPPAGLKWIWNDYPRKKKEVKVSARYVNGAPPILSDNENGKGKNKKKKRVTKKKASKGGGIKSKSNKTKKKKSGKNEISSNEDNDSESGYYSSESSHGDSDFVSKKRLRNVGDDGVIITSDESDSDQENDNDNDDSNEKEKEKEKQKESEKSDKQKNEFAYPIKFSIENTEVDPFDSRPLLRVTGEIPICRLNGWLRVLILRTFYVPFATIIGNNVTCGFDMSWINNVDTNDKNYNFHLKKTNNFQLLNFNELEINESDVSKVDNLIDAFGSIIPVLEITAYLQRQRMKSYDHDHIFAFDWINLIKKHSIIPHNFWRDVLTKILTQESENVDIAAVSREGKRQLTAIRYITEGSCLRLLHGLSILYPTVLRNTGRLRFKINQGSTHYVHMIEMLKQLAFKDYGLDKTDSSLKSESVSIENNNNNNNDNDDSENESDIEIDGRNRRRRRRRRRQRNDDNDSDESELEDSDLDMDQQFESPKRRSSRNRNRNGSKNKTSPTNSLSSLSSPSKWMDICENDNHGSIPKIRTQLWEHQAKTANRVLHGVNKGKRGFADASAVGAGKTLSALASFVKVFNDRREKGLSNHGCLVLLPNIKLIEEWKDQISQHIDGLTVLWQESNGDVKPSPLWMGSPNCIVLTTLGRSRDHPFAKQWTLVIIDECTSVQNETALQTAEAWRQVVSSDCGVLMLSATFFRSRFSKLFYMIRMLGSCIPREGPYLNALLAEHIICHVPDTRREWEIDYVGIPLTKELAIKYNKIKENRKDMCDNKALYSELKSLVYNKFTKNIILHIRETAEKLASKEYNHRRPLIFANTKKEKELILDEWNKKPKSCFVFTTHEAAYGLNMQHDCDAIITRPHPGDLMEQMKGRIDRPGQREDKLLLKIIFAKDTIEAAEAANVRICGQFIRQYLDPLSETFATMVLEKGIDSIAEAFDQYIEQEELQNGKKGKGRKKQNANTKSTTIVNETKANTKTTTKGRGRAKKEAKKETKAKTEKKVKKENEKDKKKAKTENKRKSKTTTKTKKKSKDEEDKKKTKPKSKSKAKTGTTTKDDDNNDKSKRKRKKRLSDQVSLYSSESENEEELQDIDLEMDKGITTKAKRKTKKSNEHRSQNSNKSKNKKGGSKTKKRGKDIIDIASSETNSDSESEMVSGTDDDSDFGTKSRGRHKKRHATKNSTKSRKSRKGKSKWSERESENDFEDDYSSEIEMKKSKRKTKSKSGGNRGKNSKKRSLTKDESVSDYDDEPAKKRRRKNK